MVAYDIKLGVKNAAKICGNESKELDELWFMPTLKKHIFEFDLCQMGLKQYFSDEFEMVSKSKSCTNRAELETQSAFGLLWVSQCDDEEREKVRFYSFDLLDKEKDTMSSLKATSHKRLRAHDHYTSSTLIGGKGEPGPSLLHTTLEGLMKCVNAWWMQSLHECLHGI